MGYDTSTEEEDSALPGRSSPKSNADTVEISTAQDQASLVDGDKRKPQRATRSVRRRYSLTRRHLLGLVVAMIGIVVLFGVVVGVWISQSKRNNDDDRGIAVVDNLPPASAPILTLAPTGLRGGGGGGNDIYNDEPYRCGCTTCTATALATLDANGDTCGNRIDYEINDNDGVTEAEACSIVATRYPLTCGPVCHPQKCDGQAPALCGCESCTENVWNTDANGFSCGIRILLRRNDYSDDTDILTKEKNSCQRVAEAYPEECGDCNPLTCHHRS